MADFLSVAYPWIKAFHIMAVMSWMAGLFYLPRLFVHHIESVELGSETDLLFQKMELKLLKVIMNPAMIVTWLLGLCLVGIPGLVDWSSFWPWVKCIAVLLMTAFHMWLGKQRKTFVADQVAYTGRQFRIANEIPTVLMTVIVISVVTKFL